METPVIILPGWQIILRGVPILIGMLLFETNVEYLPLSVNAWIAVLYSAFVPMIVCHLLWYTLIGMLPVAIAAISTLVIPIVGVYSSALLLLLIGAHLPPKSTSCESADFRHCEIIF
jgi:drug/metabolite transporter (DMT)-like permease